MRCHSVGSGMASQTQLATQSRTQSIFSRSHDAVIRVYDASGNVIETHEHAGRGTSANPEVRTPRDHSTRFAERTSARLKNFDHLDGRSHENLVNIIG
jgi:hypothetical protein